MPIEAPSLYFMFPEIAPPIDKAPKAANDNEEIPEERSGYFPKLESELT